MNKCQHAKTITKFCMFEHCQSKQTAGCEDCIRKYHNHIGQIAFLTEEDIKNIVKKFQIEPNYRPKSRPLQECIFNFFTHIKTNISIDLDLACKNLINEIGYPYLQKNGTLNCYKRLKNKEYRKVTQKQLKQLWQAYKVADYNDIIKDEKIIYNEAILKMEEIIEKLQKNVKEMFEHLMTMVSTSKPSAGLYDRTYFIKINDIFKEIKKYPEVNFPKVQIPKIVKKQSQKQVESPKRQKKLQRDTRDVSLDKHVKIENRLKTEVVSKIEDMIGSPKESKYKAEQKSKKQIEKEEKQKQKQKVRRHSRYSTEFKPDQVVIRQNPKLEASFDYSEKQEEINERKRKLMELMNSKSGKRVDMPEAKTTTLTPMREKSHSNRLQIGDYIKESLTGDRNMLGKDFNTPSNIAKYSTEEYSFKNTVNSNKESVNSKRVKTTFFQEEDEPVETKRQTRNETAMSSETETESLFNAKIHIPIEDHKQQEDFEIKEESVQKCIVVPVAPEVDTIAREIFEMVAECQSPLLIKKKEIENFSAFIKLAESKIFQEKQETQSSTKKTQTTKIDQEKSFVRLNKVLQDSDIKPEPQKKSENKQPVKAQKQETQTSKHKLPAKEEDSVEINDSEQMSLALLLKSLKLPGSQAIPFLEKAIQHSSNNLSAAQYLSYLYLETERPQDCLKLCNDILKLISSSQSNPLALRLNINKSAALNYLGRYSQCITFLERCLRYRHNDILYKNLADAYYSIGILEKAIYNYEHAIIENSSNTEAHYNLAVCHYQQENYYNASIYIDKALKHNPNNDVYKEMKKYNDEKILSNVI